MINEIVYATNAVLSKQRKFGIAATVMSALGAMTIIALGLLNALEHRTFSILTGS